MWLVFPLTNPSKVFLFPNEKIKSYNIVIIQAIEGLALLGYKKHENKNHLSLAS
jgi:hypothetical protein